MGSGALSGNMLLVRIVENSKIDDYFKACLLILALPRRVKKEIRIVPTGLEPPAGARTRKRYPLKLFSIILYPALNQEVQLKQTFYGLF